MLETGKPLPSLKDVDKAKLQQLAGARIYFGHMSVGYNILAGMEKLIAEYNLDLKIIETTDPAALDGPAFIHSRVGKNQDPDLKLADFARFIDDGIGSKAGLAGIKLCYVDITERTNANTLFNKYQTTITNLKQKYPGVTFIHFTSPLTTIRGGIKSLVKKLLGKPQPGVDDNVVRHQYNQFIRQTYAGSKTLFDLAKIESTAADGSRKVYRHKDKTYYALLPEYTTDGGHLNAKGQQVVAEQFLIFLADLAGR